MHVQVDNDDIGIPLICIRGPSRSGKSSLCEGLIAALGARGLQVGYIKRTHHHLDLPGKSSARIWEQTPAAMLLRAPDRLQLTLAPGSQSVRDLVAALPPGLDLVLLETHSPEPHPTVLSRLLEPAPGERVLARWSLDSLDPDAAVIAAAIESLLPADRELARHLRAAAAFHGGHACAGLVLGTRLALHGARLLGIDVPDRRKRLVVVAETQRCAADALQAVTGCRAGRRTLQFRDYGKLAATFVDTLEDRAIRVAARGDLRERAAARALPGEDRHAAQRRAYLELADTDLFTATEAVFPLDAFNLPGPPRRRVICTACGEEVSDGRDVPGAQGPLCLPCAAAVASQPARRTA